MKIGILGGIGPESTGQFYLELIRKLQKSGAIRTNEDYPQIIINSVPAPELIFDNERNQLAVYLQGLKELDEHKPDFIVMVCNTVHLYHGRLQKGIRSVLIDLREIVKKYVEKNAFRRISVLGSPHTLKKELYTYDTLQYDNPNEYESQIIGRAIFDFNRGIEKNKQKEIIVSIARKKLSDGAQCVIAACTEVGLLLNEYDLPMANTMDLLVDAVIERL